MVPMRRSWAVRGYGPTCLAEMKFRLGRQRPWAPCTQLHRVLPDGIRRLQGICRHLPGLGQPAAGYLQHHGERSAQPDQLDDYLIEKYPNDPNRRVKSARIDSGDLARGSKRLRKALDAVGKPYIKLVAPNGLDEKKIANMELYEHAHFDSYGVGENLITSLPTPCSAACTSWWLSSSRTAAIPPR